MPSALINVMSAAAIKASKGLIRDFGEVDKLQISRKGVSNFVTNADVRTEKLLVAELKKARPDFGFLLEEGGEIKGKDEKHRWIIDPLDGTSNFIHAVPYFCIAIALERVNYDGKREIIASVTYDPLHNELFAAEKGQGATLNDRRITVSRRASLEEAMIITGSPRSRWESTEGLAIVQLERVTQSHTCLRYMGACALDLAYLAAGRYDACWYTRQQPWDVAAGMLLVQEAGGIITQVDGSAFDLNHSTLLATNKELNEPMRKLLADGLAKK